MRSVVIERQFIRLGPRHIHYRFAGSGPPVILLHQSPQSSASLVPMIKYLAPYFTVIAPDTPGFGQSDALDMAEPSVDDFAAALHEFVTALKLKKFALFGQHTGGMIAASYAGHYPVFVSQLMIDGMAFFGAKEKADILQNYLPEFVPNWDGTHLTWLWARMREQHFFWPWYAQESAKSRLNLPPPTMQATHQAVLDVIAVGDVYRRGYRAAFSADGHALLQALTQTPTQLLYRPYDVLAKHAARAGELPSHIKIEQLKTHEEALQDRVLQILRMSDSNETLKPTRLREPPLVRGLQRRFWYGKSAPMHGWFALDFPGADILIHGPGENAAQAITQFGSVAKGRGLLALDWPLHGENPDYVLPVDFSRDVRELIKELGFARVKIHGRATAAAWATNIARSFEPKNVELHLYKPWCLRDGQRKDFLQHLPNLEIRPGGGHLLEVWQWLRDQGLFNLAASPVKPIRPRAAPDALILQSQLYAVLQCGVGFERMWADALPTVDAAQPYLGKTRIHDAPSSSLSALLASRYPHYEVDNN
jgi:pimeloyl-ACP methyl ester carboxylesterase